MVKRYSLSKPEYSSILRFIPTYLQEVNIKHNNVTKYHIILNGVLDNGARINVIIEDIFPFFEVRVPDEVNIDDYESTLLKLVDVYKHERIMAKPFKYYQKHLSTFIRLYFYKTKDRSDAINLLRKQHKVETATDDTSCYYRVVARDYLTTFSSWVEISNYTQTSIYQIPSDIDTICVSINNYKPLKQIPDELKKDKSIAIYYDIETWSKIAGALPLAEHAEDRLMCVSIVVQYVHEVEPIKKYILCVYESENKYLDIHTINCHTEQQLLITFADIIADVRPEFIMGFNDHDYDWKWIVTAAMRYSGTLAYMANKMSCFKHYPYDDNTAFKCYKIQQVKINAELTLFGASLELPGYVTSDVRTVYRRLYPTSELSSLKFFLECCKLESKDDMPYEKMHEAYTAYINNIPDLSTLADINKYCVVDAIRCHDLIRLKSVINDNREVANLSYTSVFDAFYRAYGHKVRNLTIGLGQQPPFNIRFSNITEHDNNADQGKYPGAFVIRPDTGLKTSKLSIQERIQKGEQWSELDINLAIDLMKKHNSVVVQEDNIPSHVSNFLIAPTYRPIVGLDFSSLYPSLIRNYNLSPEYCILDKDDARMVDIYEREQGRRGTIRVEFMYNGSIRKAWFVWHNNKMDPTNKDFQFGVFPYILDMLFNTRDEMKKILKPLAHKLETMRQQGKKATKEYSDVAFDYSYIDSKQKALKVFMNTFYGESGNSISPFFIVELAGGVTDYGKRNLQTIFAKVKDEGCNIIYGDTDSLYLSIPEKYFTEIDLKYYCNEISKIEYWTELVNLTFKNIEIIRKSVNDFFINHLVVVTPGGQSKITPIGTKFLSMAYEEVLFPCMFNAKKKYFGIPHEKKIDFTNYDIFLRGLDCKKRGASKILRVVFDEVLKTCLSIDNIYTPFELVEKKIDEIYNRQWSSDDFIQSAMYKVNRDGTERGNVKVNTFVRNMKIHYNITIKPSERFEYIMVKKYPYEYDDHGRKKEIKAGDKMELVDNVIKLNLPIDLDYYMKGSINGQFGRLIAYDKRFYIEPLSNSDDDMKISESKTYDAACKYVETYCAKYYSNYNQLGDIYKTIYKITKQVNEYKLSVTYGNFVGKLLTSNSQTKPLEEWVTSMAIAHAKRLAKIFVKKLLPPKLLKNKQLIQSYANVYGGINGIRRKRLEYYNINLNKALLEFRHEQYRFVSIYEYYDDNINLIIESIKKDINLDLNPIVNSDTKEYTIDDCPEAKHIAYETSISHNIEFQQKSKDINDFIRIYMKILSAYLIMYQIEYTDDLIRKTISNIIETPENINDIKIEGMSIMRRMNIIL